MLYMRHHACVRSCSYLRALVLILAERRHAESATGFALLRDPQTARGGSVPAAGSCIVDSIVDVKEAMRWALLSRLGEEMDLGLEGPLPLQIHLSLAHTETSTEHHSIVGSLLPAENGYAKRKRQNHGQPPEVSMLSDTSGIAQGNI